MPNQLRLHPKDPRASADQPALAAWISLPPPSMIAAIDLDDEAHTRGEKIHDVRPDHDLPAKRYAEPLRTNGLPEHVL